MNEESLIYLKDNFFLQSLKVSRKQKLLFFSLGIILILTGALRTKDGQSFYFAHLGYIQIILGLILVILPVIFSALDHFLPIPYIKFLSNSIEIKNGTFRAPIEIPFEKIEKVNFKGSTLIIEQAAPNDRTIKINLPFSRIAQIRERFSNSGKIKIN